MLQLAEKMSQLPKKREENVKRTESDCTAATRNRCLWSKVKRGHSMSEWKKVEFHDATATENGVAAIGKQCRSYRKNVL